MTHSHNHDEAPTVIAKELQQLKEQYKSYAKMAKALNSHLGFEHLDKTAIIRWISSAHEGRIPNRATLAVRILQDRQGQQGQLRIAEPEALWILPITMLHCARDGLYSPSGSTKLIPVPTASGGHAFELLRQGSVHLAAGGRELAAELPDDCPILCSIALGNIKGLFTQHINEVKDLCQMTVAYPKRSLVVQRLQSIARTYKCRHGHLIGLDIRETPAVIRDIKRKTIQGVVGWDPAIGCIEAAAKKDNLPLYPLSPHLLGDIEVVVSVNLRLVDGTLVRKFLKDLLEAVLLINRNREKAMFWKSLRPRLQVDQNDLTGISFDMVLEPSTLLTLWDREITSSRL